MAGERAVPKFGSFKSRTAKNHTNKANDPDVGHSRQREQSDDTRPEHPQRLHHKQQWPRNQTQNDRSYRRRRSASTRDLNKQDRESEFFTIDLQGYDDESIKYGCMPSYDVPKYHRFGSGAVIGRNSSTRIDPEPSSEIPVAFKSEERPGKTSERVSDDAHDAMVIADDKDPQRGQQPDDNGEDRIEEQDFVDFQRVRVIDNVYEPQASEGKGIWSFIEGGDKSDGQDEDM